MSEQRSEALCFLNEAYAISSSLTTSLEHWQLTHCLCRKDDDFPESVNVVAIRRIGITNAQPLALFLSRLQRCSSYQTFVILCLAMDILIHQAETAEKRSKEGRGVTRLTCLFKLTLSKYRYAARARVGSFEINSR